MKTMKQENKMKKEKKERPVINIEMIDKNNNHNDMTKKTAKKNNTNTDNNNNNNTKKKTIKKKHQLSCYNVFGLRGFLIYILMIAITVFHFIVGLTYSKSINRLFAQIGRPWVWAFYVLGILFFMLWWIFLLRWKKFAADILKANHTKKKLMRYNPETTPFHHIISNDDDQDVTCISWYSDNFSVNGKYYLWKLYIVEFLENWIQFYNFQQVFSCNLPLEMISIICFVMILESAKRSYTLIKRLWISSNDDIDVTERNSQVTIDIIVDMFFLIFPLAIIWYGYKILLVPFEVLSIIVPPSISLFGKLRLMLLETFAVNINYIVVDIQKGHANKFGRRHEVIFKSNRLKDVTKKQNKYFPRKAKIIVLLSSLAYCIAIISIFITQISNAYKVTSLCKDLLKSDDLVDDIYTKGCKMKVPYCKNLFVPHCDCAVINKIFHNYTTLPDGIVEMSSLKMLIIRIGPLKTLPSGMEKLKELSRLDFTMNQLDRFDVDVSKNVYLSKLNLGYNNIKFLHESVWRHKTLANLFLNSNIGLGLPLDSSKIKMPQLYFFDMRNNSAVMPEVLGIDQMPSLTFVYLNSNKFVNGVLPNAFETFRSKMTSFSVQNTELLGLPSYLSSFKYLRYLDARDNNISSIPPELSSYIHGKKFELYLSGNKKLCNSNEYKNSEACTPLCSEYCYSRNHKNNGCDAACNSKECDYDAGECAKKPLN